MKKNNPPKVFVVVLNYNGLRTISKCLSSIYQSNYANFEVVLVDNASTDGSLELVKQQFQKAHVILNQVNVGFAKGNNLGIRFALEKFAKYVLVLNNDAYLEPNTLETLVSYAEKNQAVGILSPLIFTANKKIWFAGGKIDWLRMRALHDNSRALKVPYASDYLCGCSLFISQKLFQKIGLFDEKFFLYYEDADFSIRAKKAGFKIKIIPQARIIHDEQSESNKPQKTYWLVLSGIIFFRKHTPFFLKPWTFLYLMLRKIKNRRDIQNKKDEVSLAVSKAYKDSAKV